MAKFKVTITVVVEALDAGDARRLAAQIADKGNDTVRGDVVAVTATRAVSYTPPAVALYEAVSKL